MQELNCRQRTKEAMPCVNRLPIVAMSLVYELELSFAVAKLRVNDYLG